MSEETLLTQEELDFIRKLQRGRPSLAQGAPVLTLDGAARLKKLLTHLALHEHLSLDAQIDDQRVSFPLQVIEDEQHNLQLHLGTPSVLEQLPASPQPWQLNFASPVNLHDDDKRPTTFWLCALSLSSMLVESRAGPPPQELALWLPYGAHSHLRLQGELLRQTEQGPHLYKMTLSRRRQIDRLGNFLIDRQQQPDHE